MDDNQSKQLSHKPTTLIAAGLVGNIFEWYDFAVYGFFAAIIGKQFFPSEDPTVSLIASFGAFAAGFLMRPVGAILFGYIGDSIGRKKMLTVSIILMAIPTFVLGLLPTYAHIGLAAPVLMVLVRMLQGVSVGGEYTGSIVFLTEGAPKGRRGIFSSFSLVGANVGVLLGSGVGALMTSLTTEAQLETWGWRIPFLLGISISLIGLFLRSRVADLPLPEKRATSPMIEVATTYRKPFLQAMGLNTMFAVTFYILFIYISTWLTTETGESRSTALDINTIALLALCVTIPFFAGLSDKIGRRPMLIAGSAAIALFAYPLIWLMHSDDFALILSGQVGLAVLLAVYISVIPITITELFPRHVRASAASVSYNLPFAIFGGTAPMVATWMVSRSGDALSIAWYIIAVSVLALAVSLGLTETASKDE
jgi:MHS family proline/betaine transporter-like MFS transporter